MAAPSRSASFTRALSKAKFKATTVSLIGTFLLTGCAAPSSPGASPSGTVDGSTSPSASTTPTPTPTPSATYKPADAKGQAQNVPLPVKPALADEKSKQGLEAFARYWFELESYAYETGDLKPVEAITGPNCKLCASAKPVISGWHSEGRWIEGGKVELVYIEDRFVKVVGGTYNPVVQFRQQELTYRRADGSSGGMEPVTEPPRTFVLVASYENGVWKLLDLQKPMGS